MNLLYAVSFLRPPPPEDLAAAYVSQGRPIMSGTTTHFSSPAFRLPPSFLWASTGSGPLTVGQMERADLNDTDDAWLRANKDWLGMEKIRGERLTGEGKQKGGKRNRLGGDRKGAFNSPLFTHGWLFN